MSIAAVGTDHPAERIAKEAAEGHIMATIDLDLAARLMMVVRDGLQVQWLLDPTLEMPPAYGDFFQHYFGRFTEVGWSGS